MLRVTPVYGSRWSSVGAAAEPHCLLVEYANVRLLWNVGWWANNNNNNNNNDHAFLHSSFPNLPLHDALIVTDSTMQSSGGLPLYHQQYPTTPVYATFPTVKMGQMTAYDQHAALSMDGKQSPYTLQDVDESYARVDCIKYSQSITVNGTLSFTAHRAGHVVGGAFYVLRRLQDDTSVVLTSDYHVAKELHLDSSTLLEHGATPDVLVTHPGGPSFAMLRSLAHGFKPSLPPVLVTQSERKIVDAVLDVLRREGHALLPTDASGRVLELLVLLNGHWERQRLSQTYNLVWLAPMAANTLDFARSQLEWMSGPLTRQFDSLGTSSGGGRGSGGGGGGGGGHPLQLPHVKICSSLRQLDVLLEEHPNPTCVLASGLSLEGGPARDLLLQWADNPDHSVIFTDSSHCYLRRPHRPDGDTVSPSVVSGGDIDTSASAAAAASPDATSPWTTAAQLLGAWFRAKAEGREMDDSVQVDVPVPHRAPLAGTELVEFLEREESHRREQALQREKRAMLREVELAKGQLRLGEPSDGTAAATTTATTSSTPTAAASASAASTTNTTTATAASGLPSSRPKKKSRFDSSLFVKFSKPLHMTFETREEAVGLGQDDSIAKFGIGESVGRSGEILEDDYGIAVQPEKFTDIVSGVDPSRFAGGSGRVGEDVMRRGLGYGVDGAGPGAGNRGARVGGGAGTGAARVSEDEDDGDLLDKADEQAAEAIDLSEGTGIIRGRNGRPPIKVTTVTKRLDVLAEILYLPLEGRVDARAARQSVRALQPRQVVVLGGPKRPGDEGAPTLVDEVTLLANAAATVATDKLPILTPSDGETAELNVGHAAYSVRIVDAPYLSRADREAGKEAAIPEEPFEVKLGPCTVSLLDAVATGQMVAADGSIVLAPRSAPTKDDSPRIYVSDGDVLLTDLRAELIASGMKAEYSAHAGYAQLVVNGTITVKKSSDTGEIEVEGPVCQDFYLVRSLVCRQFVTL